ncbi:MAG: peptidase S41, partial [Pedobacter sp.]
MKKTVSLLLLFLSFGAFAQTQQQIDNQYAFAKLYGYVKYFYPGDDPTKIDWDKFAIYGTQKVENCKNSSELKSTLNELVGSIMPGVKVIDKVESYKFDADLLTPNNLTGYNVVSWQHLGLGSVKEIESIYRSARTNRPQVYKSTFEGFGNASSSLEATSYLGKSIELTGKAKMVSGSGDGHLWMRMDDAAGKFTFFDNMDDRPIKDKEWATFKIAANIDTKTQNIYFGTFLVGIGSFLVDDLSLKIDGKEVYSANFEAEVVGTSPKSINVASPRSKNEKTDYKFLVAEKNGNK